MPSHRSLSTAIVLLLSACGGRSAGKDASPVPAPAGALAAVAAEQVLLLPVQSLASDTAGWRGQTGSAREYLRALDDSIAAALRERDLAPLWVLPSEITRLARRNPLYAPDPASLSAAPLRPPVSRRDDGTVPDPLASQIRSLVALRDARLALLPVELRVEPVGGATRAVLHLVLIDARLAQVRWRGEVVDSPAPAFSPAVAGRLAARFADLLSAR